MTAIGAAWDADGRVWIAADSRCSGHARIARKWWRWGNLTLALAGDEALALWLQRQHAIYTPAPALVEDRLWGLVETIREHAAATGQTREGTQGQRFASADLVATDGRRLWLLMDGWSVEEINRSTAVVGIGDRTAVEAAYLAAVAGGATPGPVALEHALVAVCRVWHGAGLPVEIVNGGGT